MCARYSLKSNPLELQAEFELADVPVLHPRYNIAPTQAAPIVTAAHPHALTIARWGLVPQTHTFNARAETLSEKGIFKDSFAHRRCLIPVDGFYEWRQVGKLRQPLHLSFSGHRPFSIAGIWESRTSPEGISVVSFSLVTTAANEFMRRIHDRMPAVIAREDRHRWLTDDAHAHQLLQPWAGEALSALEVSQAVNKVAIDDPRCLEPAKTVQLSLL